MPRDRWLELCSRVADDDQLPVREVGSWTEDKLFYWNRYIEITTTAMVGSPRWGGGVVYVDLFGGPGICTLRESGKRIPGSALLAAMAPKPFTRILVCEKDPKTADACRTRLSKLTATGQAIVFEGDCNEKISEIEREIPERALVLAFIDPEGLHVDFNTIQTLANDRRVDLLVLFADRYDVVRNIQLYLAQQDSNLDRFLGCGEWRKQLSELPSHDAASLCKFFTAFYQQQLIDRLQYQAVSDEVMKSVNTALYRVVYASKHPKGLEFWDKIKRIDGRGQLALFPT